MKYKFTTAPTIREATGITPEAWDKIRLSIEATFQNIAERARHKVGNDEITALEYFLNHNQPSDRTHAAIACFLLAKELYRYGQRYQNTQIQKIHQS